jgi:hypothetical protein
MVSRGQLILFSLEIALGSPVADPYSLQQTISVVQTDLQDLGGFGPGR